MIFISIIAFFIIVGLIVHFSVKNNSHLEQLPLTYLPLDNKTRNYLLEAGVLTAEQLAKKTDEELLAIKGIGPGRIKEIRKAVRFY